MTTVTSNRSVFPARTGKTRRSPFLQSGECDSRTQAPLRRCPLERCLSWTPHDRPKTDFELRAVPCSAGSRAAPAKPMSSHHLAFECGPGRAAGEGTPLHFVSHVPSGSPTCGSWRRFDATRSNNLLLIAAQCPQPAAWPGTGLAAALRGVVHRCGRYRPGQLSHSRVRPGAPASRRRGRLAGVEVRVEVVSRGRDQGRGRGCSGRPGHRG